MARALCLTIADSDIRLDNLALVKHISIGNLLVAQPHPTGVQPKRLCQEHEVLAIIADTLVQVISFLPCHDQITGHITELAVLSQRSLESLWLVLNQLDVKTPPLVDFSNLLFQLSAGIFCQRLILVSPHTMPGFYGFL